jgi:F0F1-type ATP synthase assembly protein I
MTLQDPDSSKAPWVKAMGLFSVILTEFLGFTGVGVGAGYLLWKKAGFPAWTMGVLSFLGLCFAFYRLYLISQKDWS